MRTGQHTVHSKVGVETQLRRRTRGERLSVFFVCAAKGGTTGHKPNAASRARCAGHSTTQSSLPTPLIRGRWSLTHFGRLGSVDRLRLLGHDRWLTRRRGGGGRGTTLAHPAGLVATACSGCRGSLATPGVRVVGVRPGHLQWVKEKLERGGTGQEDERNEKCSGSSIPGFSSLLSALSVFRLTRHGDKNGMCLHSLH